MPVALPRFTKPRPSLPIYPVVFFRGPEKVAAARGIAVAALLRDVDTIVHGTTITTNATLTGDGAKTGFVTTAGFRDVLNMRRGLKERQFKKYAAPPLFHAIWCAWWRSESITRAPS